MATVSFRDPPVVEVALSVQFAAVAGLASYRSGLLFERWRTAYPVVSPQPEVPPLPAFDAEDGFFLQVGSGPTGSRLFFETTDGTFLVQMQGDRLTVNWRRMTAAAYPRYPAVRERFEAAWRDVTDVLHVVPKVDQVEVSYVNHISRSADEVLQGWDNPTCRQSDGRFSAVFEQSVHLDATRQARRQTTVAGRYGDSAQTRLSLVVRSIPREGDPPLVAIDACRTDVVDRFRQITTAALHQEWGVVNEHVE